MNKGLENWSIVKKEKNLFLVEAKELAKKIGVLFFIEFISLSGNGIETNICFCPIVIDQGEAERAFGCFIKTFAGIFNLYELKALQSERIITSKSIRPRIPEAVEMAN